MSSCPFYLSTILVYRSAVIELSSFFKGRINGVNSDM
uniref:Uncharacterized protein n=1 Tax=Arundo donax TaxID=35708 RepID=A0A0A9AIH2_ARUDO